MIYKTVKLLNDLGDVEWFKDVGEPQPGPVIVTQNWETALANFKSAEWESLRLKALNDLKAKLKKADPQRYQLWNKIVEEIIFISEPLVLKKTKKIVVARKLPASFIEGIQRDILYAALEEEFADIQTPSFYASLARWYLRGRFPCGWKGKNPEGQIVIF